MPLTPPLAAVKLRLLFMGRRLRIQLCDHMVFALHTLAFGMLPIVVVM